MLNSFPELLTYSFFAPFILRIVAGLVFIDLGILIFKGEKATWINSFRTLRIPKPELAAKILGIVEIIGGAMLIIGLYTQIVVLILAVIIFAAGYIEYHRPEILKRDLIFYVMLLVILLSLLLTGAGAFAFDLPL
ncbi:MAG: DoxX family protein [Candidatus Zambryskibacteria bacterium]|nr:DoxX family protein [Candidatus Zambryskibacteria bacterium]